MAVSLARLGCRPHVRQVEAPTQNNIYFVFGLASLTSATCYKNLGLIELMCGACALVGIHGFSTALWKNTATITKLLLKGCTPQCCRNNHDINMPQSITSDFALPPLPPPGNS
jgi:hypothetical protein